MTRINKDIITELLKLRPNNSLYHREAKDLEFKESFNLAGIGEYLRNFSAFANNSWWYIIFWVTDSPRKLKWLSDSSKASFLKVDEEKISGYINEHFSPYMDWELGHYEIDDKFFWIFYIYKSNNKPVICKKDSSDTLKNWSIYYRYAGRTQIIEYAELSQIIEWRIDENNKLWVQQVKSIGEAWPSNIWILNTKKGLIETQGNSLLIDEGLIKKIKFIKEGEFSESKWAITLKLVWDINPIEKVEVEKIVQKRLTDDYPYSYDKLEQEVRKTILGVKKYKVQWVIRDNWLKWDITYSAYNFRNKDHEDNYKTKGDIQKWTASIYNNNAVEFIIKVLSNE